MFKIFMHLSIFCLYFFLQISMDMVEEQVMEETDPNLEGREDFRISEYMEDHWKEVEK